MKRLIIILFVLPLFIYGQKIDLNNGDYKVDATNIEFTGTTDFVGALKLQGSAGTAGQVLVSAAGGNTVWGAVQISSNLYVKDPVACATTANITLSGEQTIDGVLTSTNRVLVKNQTSADENGIYVSAAGAWSRAADAATWDTLTGAYVAVSGGTVNATAGYYCTITTGVLETDDITWSLFTIPTSLTAGNGLDLTGQTLSVNVDDATIEINSDNIRAKTAAVTNGATTLATGDQIYDYVTAHINNQYWKADGDNIYNDNVGTVVDNTGWKWMAYGDSFTATSSYYRDQVQDHIRFSSVVSRGIGGYTCIQIHNKMIADTTADNTYYDDVDLLTIQFSHNDWADGTITLDTVNTRLTAMIQLVLTLNPKVRIFVISGIGTQGAGASGWSKKELSDEMKTVCANYAIPVIDWQSESGINDMNWSEFTDNVHPKADAAARLGRIAAKHILNGY